MLISEKYNTRIEKYIFQELVENRNYGQCQCVKVYMWPPTTLALCYMSVDAPDLLVDGCYGRWRSGRRAGALWLTFSGFTRILIEEGHGHTQLYLWCCTCVTVAGDVTAHFGGWPFWSCISLRSKHFCFTIRPCLFSALEIFLLMCYINQRFTYLHNVNYSVNYRPTEPWTLPVESVTSLTISERPIQMLDISWRYWCISVHCPLIRCRPCMTAVNTAPGVHRQVVKQEKWKCTGGVDCMCNV